MVTINIHKSWRRYLNSEFETEKMAQLKKFLAKEQKNKKIIFPEPENIFYALELVALQSVKVVILGQDPYHGQGQAHGLSFSVPQNVALPPSLRNIFKELHSDLEIQEPGSGDLTRWAQQGVLLLNSVLTVEKDLAASHQNKGWEEFTDKVISVINDECQHVVFILWGSYAQKKVRYLDSTRHLVIKSAHPSPLSSYRGFFGSRPFSQANQWLESKGISAIQW